MPRWDDVRAPRWVAVKRSESARHNKTELHPVLIFSLTPAVAVSTNHTRADADTYGRRSSETRSPMPADRSPRQCPRQPRQRRKSQA